MLSYVIILFGAGSLLPLFVIVIAAAITKPINNRSHCNIDVSLFDRLLIGMLTGDLILLLIGFTNRQSINETANFTILET